MAKLQITNNNIDPSLGKIHTPGSLEMGQLGWEKENYSQNPLKQAKKAPEPTSADRMEITAGGYNYNLDRETGVNEQGQWNALQGTGHVAGIPVQPEIQPSQEKVGKRLSEGPQKLAALERSEQAATTPTPTARSSQPVSQKPAVEQPVEEPVEETVEPEAPAEPEAEPEMEEGYTEAVVSKMEDNLNQSTEGELYGKVTADMSTGITTLEDANSVYKAGNEARVSAVKDILGMNSKDIASMLASGFNPFSDMAMRDLMQFAPEKYQQIQQEIKKIRVGDTVNSIASGGGTYNYSQTEVNNVNSGVDTWAQGISSNPRQTGDMIHNLTNAMNNNQVANTAKGEMLNINAQLADYEEKLNNIDRDVKKMFKGDTPDYVVAAKKSELRQQYQSEINKLQSRYNSVMDLYKSELANEQRKEEMNLKYLQFQQNKAMDQWQMMYQREQLKQNAIKRVDGKAYQVNSDGSITQLMDNTATLQYKQQLQQGLQGYISVYTSGGATKTANGYKYNVSGGQCEVFTDNFTEAVSGLRMEALDGSNRGYTYGYEKEQYVNTWVPEPGMIAVGVGGIYNEKYGHTMIVTGFDPASGTLDLLWSNKNGDEMVYSSTMNINDFYGNGGKGFWDPYQDLIKQGTSGGGYQYGYFNTPMANAFQRLNTDSSLTAGQKAQFGNAMEMYHTLYNLESTGTLETLINSGDLDLILKDMKGQKFTDEDKGGAFLNALKKGITNKMSVLAGGEDSYNALLDLQRMIEIKLRDESGAAISSSEWNSNFSLLLPQPGETEGIKREKLNRFERIVSKKFLEAGGRMDEYIPIFNGKGSRDIWAY